MLLSEEELERLHERLPIRVFLKTSIGAATKTYAK